MLPGKPNRPRNEKFLIRRTLSSGSARCIFQGFLVSHIDSAPSPALLLGFLVD